MFCINLSSINTNHNLKVPVFLELNQNITLIPFECNAVGHSNILFWHT